MAATVSRLRHAPSGGTVISTPVSEDLVLFEKWLKQLQVEWDKFFAGVEKKLYTH